MVKVVFICIVFTKESIQGKNTIKLKSSASEKYEHRHLGNWYNKNFCIEAFLCVKTKSTQILLQHLLKQAAYLMNHLVLTSFLSQL